MRSSSAFLLAAAYEFSALKSRCLTQCSSLLDSLGVRGAHHLPLMLLIVILALNGVCLGAYVNSVASNVLFELYCGAGKVTPQDQNRHEPGERYPGAETMFVAADERLRVREALADLPQKEKTCCVGCSSKVVTETKSAGS